MERARTTTSPAMLPSAPSNTLLPDAVHALAAAGLDPADPRWSFTVPISECGLRTGLSTPSVYAAMARGDIPSLKLGRRRTIPRAAFEKWLAGRTAADPEGLFS